MNHSINLPHYQEHLQRLRPTMFQDLARLTQRKVFQEHQLERIEPFF